jgi:hypothetical protein
LLLLFAATLSVGGVVVGVCGPRDGGGRDGVAGVLQLQDGAGELSLLVSNFAAKAIYIFDTVRHVLTILPHAGEGRIANGDRPFCGRFGGQVYLNDRSLLDRCLLKGPEDAILVFR